MDTPSNLPPILIMLVGKGSVLSVFHFIITTLDAQAGIVGSILGAIIVIMAIILFVVVVCFYRKKTISTSSSTVTNIPLVEVSHPIHVFISFDIIKQPQDKNYYY